MTGKLRADVEALAGMTRDSAGAGEREAAAWVRDRLAAAGARDARLEPFRGQATYAWSHLVHAGLGLLASGMGGPRGAALAAATFASLDLEVSGRLQWVRRLLPSGEGANAVARIPAAGQPRATLVLLAHVDAAHTGFLWRIIKDDAKGAARRKRRRALAPLAAPLGGAVVLAAAGGLLDATTGSVPRRTAGRRLRAASAAALLANAAGLLDIARSPTVPGANDNATGVAAVIELARRLAAEPLDGVDVLVVTPGAEESGMEGFAAFLAAHREELRPASTFVLSLDSIGCGTPAVLRAEATLLPQRYADEDLALVDAGARHAGLEPPQRWRLGGWTDPILARFAGLRAASILSFGEHGRIVRYHVLEDTPEAIDWLSVSHCVAIAEGTARIFAAER